MTITDFCNYISKLDAVRLQSSDGFVMIAVACVLCSVHLVRDEAEGYSVLVSFLTRESMYVFSQLRSLPANATSYLTLTA
jgi:hypothetical protein